MPDANSKETEAQIANSWIGEIGRAMEWAKDDPDRRAKVLSWLGRGDTSQRTHDDHGEMTDAI